MEHKTIQSSEASSIHFESEAEGNAEERTNPSQQSENHLPFVPMSVEELSLVQRLTYWTNCNVRVVGTFTYTDLNEWILQGNQKTHKLFLNLECVGQYPKYGDLIEVFGTLEDVARSSTQDHRLKIKLKVKFYRSFAMVDMVAYNKALSMMKPLIPLFFKTK